MFVIYNDFVNINSVGVLKLPNQTLLSEPCLTLNSSHFTRRRKYHHHHLVSLKYAQESPQPMIAEFHHTWQPLVLLVEAHVVLPVSVRSNSVFLIETLIQQGRLLFVQHSFTPVPGATIPL